MSDQNKQQNNLTEVNNKATNFNVSTVTIFKDNTESLYLYKKTEKLVSATYLLSGFISDKEPIKWQLREAGIELLSLSLSLSNKSSGDRVLNHVNFISTGLKFLSFLEVSFVVGIISEMNYNILKFEFEALIKTAESGAQVSGARGLIFSENFFNVSAGINQGEVLNQENNFSLVSDIPSKGHNIMSDRMSLKKTAETVRPSDLKQKDKSNRQDIIIGLLKKGGELGIKDFTSAIKDCSEKTIQRELVILVSKGQIKKQGEKRWSRYSLK